jgi:hypothetical protein
MKKQYLLLILLFILGFQTQAQLQIATAGTNYLITFDGNSVGVNNGAFQGTGFSPSPVVGQLNSNAWETTGMSEGSSAFGATKTSGVFAKGVSEGEVVDGGFYAFDVEDSPNNTNYAFGFQPTQDDFTPGTITLKIQNTTGQYIDAINLAFKIWCFNDYDYSTKLSFAYSYDNITFIDVPVLDYKSPASFVLDPFKGGTKWESSLIGTVINNLALATNGFLYLRWTSDDLNALTTEPRDEIALDDINVIVSTTTNPAPLIENVVYTKYPTTSDAITVTANVSDVNGTVSSVKLKYGTSTGLYTETPVMTNTSGNQYSYTIPANTFVNNSSVFFAIEASDNASAIGVSNEYSVAVRNAVTTTLPYTEPFESSLGDCYPFSVTGSKKSWYWFKEKKDKVAEASGYNSGEAEEDWLILPGLDLSAVLTEVMDFKTWYNYGLDDVGTFDLVYSTDYPGTGSPNGYTWISLPFQKPTGKNEWYYSELVELPAFIGGRVYLAFKYTNPNYEYRTWRVDDIHISSSTVIYPQPDNYPINFTATAVSASEIITTWTDALGPDVPFGYHIKVNTTGVFTPPGDGTSVPPDPDLSDGEGSVNIFHGGFEEVSWTGLLPNTTYYFIIYSYSNSGSLIDFKTDGSPPTANAITNAGSSAQLGDVIITEFMASPGSVYDSYGEWFEIFNTTAFDINLNGWLIESFDGANNIQHTISDPTLIIKAKSFLVLGINADVLTNGGVPVDYTFTDIFLNNTSDYISITSDSRILINRIDWDSSLGWNIRTGQSLIFAGNPLIIDDNKNVLNWIPSLVREKGYNNTTQSDLGSPRTNGLFQNLIDSTTWTGTGNWSEGNKPGQTNWSNGSPGSNVQVTIQGTTTIDLPNVFPAKCGILIVDPTGTVILPAKKALTTK